MKNQLYMGCAEIDITPPVGTMMAGALEPRPSKGTADPLMLKTAVFKLGGKCIVYSIFDTAGFYADIGNRMIEAAVRKTGIPARCFVWSCTHTHSGPCTWSDVYADNVPDPVNKTWMNTLPDKFAECTKNALARLAPVRMCVARRYNNSIMHNRRLRFKDGREINTWLLNNGEENLQCVGAAGPIDPEIGVIGFRDTKNKLRLVLFNFALHANARWGDCFSGDYSAVVASRIRESFGADVITCFLPGACGDINPVVGFREIGNILADEIIKSLFVAETQKVLSIGITQQRIVLPLRDASADQNKRLKDSQWPQNCWLLFCDTQRRLRVSGRRNISTIISAWHFNDVSFCTFPGEAFVELGLFVKQNSPFQWTFPVALANDYTGYLITEKACEAGGYESLVSSVGLVTPQGSKKILAKNIKMLKSLHRSYIRNK